MNYNAHIHTFNMGKLVPFFLARGSRALCHLMGKTIIDERKKKLPFRSVTLHRRRGCPYIFITTHHALHMSLCVGVSDENKLHKSRGMKERPPRPSRMHFKASPPPQTTREKSK